VPEEKQEDFKEEFPTWDSWKNRMEGKEVEKNDEDEDSDEEEEEQRDWWLELDMDWHISPNWDM